MDDSRKERKIEAVMTSIERTLKAREKDFERLEHKEEKNGREQLFLEQETRLRRDFEYLIKEVKTFYRGQLGWLAPSVVDIERSVIGACILERDAIARVCSHLRPEHFFNEVDQVVFKAILLVKDVESPAHVPGTPKRIDMHTVVNQLRKMDVAHLFEVSPAYYVADLTSRVSSAANIEYHARIIIETAMKREMIKACSTILHSGYQDTTDPFEMLDEAETTFSRIRSWIKQ